MNYEDISLDLFENRRCTPFEVSPEGDPVGFGKLRSDHIFLMDYRAALGAKGWTNPRIIPYHQGIPDLMTKGLKLGSKVLHYGYSCFEGAKAFRHSDGELYTFRLDQKAERFACSARMLTMPPVDEEVFEMAVNYLLDIDRLHFPTGVEGASLYIRPFMFAMSDQLGVPSGSSFTFAIFLSPSGPYYEDGFDPINLLVQPYFHRAVTGGVGGAKAGGNYAGASRPGSLADLLGCSQTLFLSPEEGFVEEVGTSGFAMVENGKLVLPEKADTILDSITVRTVEQLAPQEPLNMSVSREKISIDRLLRGLDDGTVSEVIGLGTAAVVSPVRSLRIIREEEIDPCILERVRYGKVGIEELVPGDRSKYVDELLVGDGETGEFTQRLFDFYTGIQNGTVEDRWGFLKKVEIRV
tara:strand:- start:596 stop:1822 length:1227 start_codon:yes stop_codon:yes gene_type:complete